RPARGPDPSGRRLTTLALGCIAHDYTGTSDLANALRTNGLRVIQTIELPDAAIALPVADAVVMASSNPEIFRGRISLLGR
ncbi:MAG TPA: hypothetical protein VHX12_07545, partial [Acidisoma sp.]|nr:hypothetical protein [Acidisoma sp.]